MSTLYHPNFSVTLVYNKESPASRPSTPNPLSSSLPFALSASRPPTPPPTPPVRTPIRSCMKGSSMRPTDLSVHYAKNDSANTFHKMFGRWEYDRSAWEQTKFALGLPLRNTKVYYENEKGVDWLRKLRAALDMHENILRGSGEDQLQVRGTTEVEDATKVAGGDEVTHYEISNIDGAHDKHDVITGCAALPVPIPAQETDGSISQASRPVVDPSFDVGAGVVSGSDYQALDVAETSAAESSNTGSSTAAEGGNRAVTTPEAPFCPINLALGPAIPMVRTARRRPRVRPQATSPPLNEAQNTNGTSFGGRRRASSSWTLNFLQEDECGVLGGF